MKCFLFIVMLFIWLLNASAGNNAFTSSVAGADRPAVMKDDTIRVIAAQGLRDLVNEFIAGYRKSGLEVNFSLTDHDPGSMVNPGSIYFLASDPGGEQPGDLTWKQPVGHNPVVAVFSTRNPGMEGILKLGITEEEMGNLLSGRISWSEITESGIHETVRTYMLNDEGIDKILAGFTGIPVREFKATFVSSPSDLIKVLISDPLSLGFCRLADIPDQEAGRMSDNLRVLPIDKNMNGRIDYFENVYDSPAELLRAVWIGKYPHGLSGSIYIMSDRKPSGKNETGFLSWILTDGDAILTAKGYSGLVSIEKESALADLTGSGGSDVQPDNAGISIPWLLILLSAFTAGLLIIIILGFAGVISPARPVRGSIIHEAFRADAVVAPKGLYYDRSHTWSYMEKDGFIRMGIDDFIPRLTGAISKLRLKEPGTVVRRGEEILTIIKDGKQIRMYAPVSGRIMTRNERLMENAAIISSSPYSGGWIYLIEPKNWIREIQLMFMADNYNKWIEDELIRLRNFLTGTLKPGKEMTPGLLILQDGGELTDQILADLGPEVWEEFQSSFIDMSK